MNHSLSQKMQVGKTTTPTQAPVIIDNTDIRFLKDWFDRANRDPRIELELKFKNIGSQSDFDRLLIALQNAFPENKKRVLEIQDRFYETRNPLEKIRCSRIQNKDAFVKKTRVCSKQYFSEFDIVATLDLETPIEPIPESEVPTMFREKCRFQFFNDLFVFDLSVVKTGKSIEVINAGNFTKSFEVELEFIGNKNHRYIFRERYFFEELTKLINYIESLLQGCGEFFQLTSKSDRSRIYQFFYTLLSHPDTPFVETRPHTVQKHHLPEILSGKYAVTPKADGFRKFLVFETIVGAAIRTPTAYLFDIATQKVQKTRIVCSSEIGATVVDGEWMPAIRKFLAFDVLYFQGNDCRAMPLEKRRLILEKINNAINSKLFALKEIYLNNVGDQVSRIVSDNERAYRIDGLIFVPKGGYSDDEAKLYKWKPNSENTIDFAIFVDGNGACHLYNLCRNSEKEFVYNGQSVCRFPYHNELKWDLKKPLTDGKLLFHGAVAECRWNAEQQMFEPIALREDKIAARKYGNGLNIALSNWNSIQNPVVLEDFKKQPVADPAPQPPAEPPTEPAAVQQPSVAQVCEAVRRQPPQKPTAAQVAQTIAQQMRQPAKRKPNRSAEQSVLKKAKTTKPAENKAPSVAAKTKLNIKQLKDIARERGIEPTVYRQLNKKQLVELLFEQNKVNKTL